MDENEKFDQAVEAYEKNFDKAANVLGKVGRGANHLYNGCLLLFVNLFFGAFCLWGTYMAFNAYKLGASGETTAGIVVELEESSMPEGGCCVYSPIIEFQANGQRYTFNGDVATNPPTYKVGEAVQVLYDPADPNTAQINKWSERWLTPLILTPSMILAAMLVNFFSIRAWRRGESLAPD